MPPKKNSNAVEEELEEIRKSLNFMSEELSKVAKQEAMILDLMNEIKQLKNLVRRKRKSMYNEDLTTWINPREGKM